MSVRVITILTLIKRNMKIVMFRTVSSQSVPSASFHQNAPGPTADYRLLLQRRIPSPQVLKWTFWDSLSQFLSPFLTELTASTTWFWICWWRKSCELNQESLCWANRTAINPQYSNYSKIGLKLRREISPLSRPKLSCGLDFRNLDCQLKLKNTKLMLKIWRWNAIRIEADVPAIRLR